MSRPSDWSALDRGADPIPGDPDAVRAGGRAYVDVANSIGRAVRALRSMELDGDRSDATDELITNAGDVADSISRAEDRYRETGLALLDYAPRLASAQQTSLEALHLAQGAREEAADAERSRSYYEGLAEGAEGDTATDYRERAQRYENAADGASGDLQRARNNLEDAIAERDAAARDAEERIREIVDSDGLNDSWWDNWGADLLAAITDIAGWVSTIAGILALCVSWIPVIGQALAGVLLIIAGIAAVINALGNIILASAGERTWTEAVISIAGAALSVIGLGGAARAVGKLATVARINRAAMRQPLGPGEVLHVVPLRNANRYTVAQLRESEAMWRTPVRDLAPDTPLYRLYGDGSGQIGGSFGSVNPRTLDFPHNTLGLPRNNSMERMATFEINPGATPVNQRHALPYEGTLGGAPEYVFPRGNGVTVVDDVPFSVP
jgi:hypothetical protein